MGLTQIKRIRSVEYTGTLNIPVSQYGVIRYDPPQGYLERILELYLTISIPSGGSSGSWTCMLGIEHSGLTYGTRYPYGARFIQTYNAGLTIEGHYLVGSVTTRYPSDDVSMMNTLRSLYMGSGVRDIYSALPGSPSSSSPATYSFHLWIANNTNVGGNFTVILRLLLESTKVR